MNFHDLRRNLKRSIRHWDTTILERWLQTFASYLPEKAPAKKPAKKTRRAPASRRKHA